jgi:3-phenylpropionate/trans-cinnamate dioxygenase ferredoxin subunit
MSRLVPVGPLEELAPGRRRLAFVDGRSVVLFNLEGSVHAIDNSCPHNGASLASGQLEGTVLRCPAHGLRFDLVTGCMPGAGGLCLKKLPVQVQNGLVSLVVEDSASSPNSPGS